MREAALAALLPGLSVRAELAKKASGEVQVKRDRGLCVKSPAGRWNLWVRHRLLRERDELR